MFDIKIDDFFAVANAKLPDISSKPNGCVAKKCICLAVSGNLLQLRIVENISSEEERR